MNIVTITFLILCIPYILSVIISPFYFKYGFCKWFYHDIMNWHRPKESEENSFDGCSEHNHCKFCGKEIMQDSQGNWFTF